MGKAAFEIGVDRQIDRRAQRGEMRADIVDGDPIVGLSNRPCKARTGGRKRLEPQMLQRQRAPTSHGLGIAKQRTHASSGMWRVCLEL